MLSYIIAGGIALALSVFTFFIWRAERRQTNAIIEAMQAEVFAELDEVSPDWRERS